MPNHTIEDPAPSLSPAGALEPAQCVESRRFDHPSRLAPADIERVRDSLRRALPEIERDLRALLRTAPKLALLELGEVNADAVANSLTPPFAALRFCVERQPGWLVWDCAAALDALETGLGAPGPSRNAARVLSRVERSLFVRALGAAVAKLARSLELTADGFELAQDQAALGGWRHAGANAEPQRLMATISIEVHGAASTWTLYLPGVLPAPPNASAHAAPSSLPAHLAGVPVGVRAWLAVRELSLAQILELEVGDVIALAIAQGTPLRVLVEDQDCARAAIGSFQGRLALQVTEIERPKSRTHSSDELEPMTDALSLESALDAATQAVLVEQQRLAELAPGAAPGVAVGLANLVDVPLAVTVQVGHTKLTLGELVNLGPGSLVVLDRAVHAPADVLVNGKIVARGEVVTIDGKYGVRVAQIVQSS